MSRLWSGKKQKRKKMSVWASKAQQQKMHACLHDSYTNAHIRIHACTHERIHTHTRARTHARTHAGAQLVVHEYQFEMVNDIIRDKVPKGGHNADIEPRHQGRYETIPILVFGWAIVNVNMVCRAEFPHGPGVFVS